MTPHEPNGHANHNHLSTGPAGPAATDPADPLAEAEALRSALADVGVRAGRLVAALKHQKREKKALTQVWAGLKQLNLGPGGHP